MKDPYKAKDPEKWRAYARESRRKWREENREKYLEEKREYYRRNKEAEYRRVRQWLDARHPNIERVRNKRWRRRNRLPILLFCIIYSFLLPDVVEEKRYLSDDERESRRREWWRNSRSKRRARIRKVKVEHVDVGIVWTRDRGVCQICYKKVKKKEEAHFDHIIPLSKGGEHSYRNIVTAHGTCNMRKHSRIVPQQLLLIGK